MSRINNKLQQTAALTIKNRARNTTDTLFFLEVLFYFVKSDNAFSVLQGSL